MTQDLRLRCDAVADGSRHVIAALAAVEGKGDTILMVEHDEDTIRRTEHVIDLDLD